jgi:hypothetical protein
LGASPDVSREGRLLNVSSTTVDRDCRSSGDGDATRKLVPSSQMCKGRAVSVLERIRRVIGQGGVSIPTLEDAAVGAPRGGQG